VKQRKFTLTNPLVQVHLCTGSAATATRTGTFSLFVGFLFRGHVIARRNVNNNAGGRLSATGIVVDVKIVVGVLEGYL
jgi:hypothetical protein